MLHRAEGLTESTYVVPETALESLEAGARVFWVVEANLPDGRRSTSRTFVVTVE